MLYVYQGVPGFISDDHSLKLEDGTPWHQQLSTAACLIVRGLQNCTDFRVNLSLES
jgi:hypothetical protein